MKKIYRCNRCHNTYFSVCDTDIIPSCCGVPCEVLKTNEDPLQFDHHIPVAVCQSNDVHVRIGPVEHVSVLGHHIEWIGLETNQGFYLRKLDINQAPKVTYHLTESEKPICVYAFCNLHGLWTKEIQSL